jgi:hypothetical protein
MEKQFISLSTLLSNLKSGNRSWFWFCPEQPDFPILMEPFSSKTGMKRLMTEARSRTTPTRARICTGISAISNEGIHQFACPMFEEGMLEVLADFVQSNVQKYPELAHLRESRFVVVNASGGFERIYENPKLWRGVRKPLLQGSIGDASSILRFLETDEDAWIWMSEDPHSAEPLVVVLPIKKDSKGKQFTQLVMEGRLRSKSKEPGLRGTIRLLSTGVLLITTKDSTSNVGEKLLSWLKKQGNVLVAQISGDEVVSAIRIGGRDPNQDFTLQVTALSAMKDGEKYLFWFSSKTKLGPPLLLIHKSKVALRSLAYEVQSSAPFVRGTVKRQKYGLKLSIRKKFPELLPALSEWVATNREEWPILQEIVGARVILSNNKGEIIKRIKNNAAWLSLEEK